MQYAGLFITALIVAVILIFILIYKVMLPRQTYWYYGIRESNIFCIHCGERIMGCALFRGVPSTWAHGGVRVHCKDKEGKLLETTAWPM